MTADKDTDVNIIRTKVYLYYLKFNILKYLQWSKNWNKSQQSHNGEHVRPQRNVIIVNTLEGNLTTIQEITIGNKIYETFT